MSETKVKEIHARGRFERALMTRYGTKVSQEKLHGGTFQSGLPDSMIFWPSGEILLIEYKVGEPHCVSQVIDLLQGRQRLVLLRLGVRKAHSWVLVRRRDTRHDSEPCWTLVWVADLCAGAERLNDELVWMSLEEVIDLLAFEVPRITRERASVAR